MAILDALVEKLHPLLIDHPGKRARRAVTQSVRKGFLSQLEPSALPALLSLVTKQGLGAHMVHGVWAASAPERLALCDARRQMTYAQVHDEADRLANALADRARVARRTPVILMMENRCEYVLSWLATMRLGAWAVHASYRSRVEELHYQVVHSKARHIVVDEARLGVVEQMLSEHTFDEPPCVIVARDKNHSPLAHDAFHDLQEMIDTGRAGAATRAGKPESANVVYTSGTTGKPKGAVRDFTAFGAEEFFRILERLDVRVADRHLIVAPLYHSGAQAFCLLMTALGATLYLEPHFDAANTLRALSRHRIHSIFMVPTMIRRILELEPAVHAKNPTPHLRAIVSGAAPFPQTLREAAIMRFGERHLFDFYGATELGWVTLIRGDEMRKHPGSVGRAVAGQELAIMSEEGEMLPAGEVGLVHVRNQQTMQGYLDNARATQEIHRGHWVSVEDLGRLDEEGYLYIEGRARDMIISGGVNIYPVEIEEVLARHPRVVEVAVVGVPDEAWGERLVACYASEDGESIPEQEFEELSRESLAGYKTPRQWERVDVLPRNPTGKVLKRSLRERFTSNAHEQIP